MFEYFQETLRFGAFYTENATKQVILGICIWKVQFFLVGTQNLPQMIYEGYL